MGDPYTAEEAYEIQSMSQQYLSGEIEDIESLTSVRQANEFLMQMRNLFRKLKQEHNNLLAVEDHVRSDKIGSAEEIKRQKTKLEGAGELVDLGGFGLGVAPREAKPVTKIEISKEREEEIARMEEFEEFQSTNDELLHEQEEQRMLQAMSRSRARKTDPRPAIDKQAAFLEFKGLESESGPQHENTIRECRAAMKETRGLIRQTTEKCNAIKSQIDKLKDALDAITQEKKQQHMMQAGLSKGAFLDHDDEPAEDIIDEQELFKLKEMKELKRQYRAAFTELKELKNEASYNQKCIDNAKTQLVQDFEIWYADNFIQPTDDLHEVSRHSAKKSVPSPGKLIRDPEMDEDLGETQAPEREGVDVDGDALAYIRARKNVITLANAKKLERM